MSGATLVQAVDLVLVGVQLCDDEAANRVDDGCLLVIESEIHADLLAARTLRRRLWTGAGCARADHQVRDGEAGVRLPYGPHMGEELRWHRVDRPAAMSTCTSSCSAAASSSPFPPCSISW
jgi:hypothetical protein